MIPNLHYDAYVNSELVGLCSGIWRVASLTARILLLRLLIKHLALCTQPIALGHQIVNLLSPLQDALDSLVKHNLGLVQLALDLHDAVGLVRVLVLDNVILQLREGERGRAVGPLRARVGGQELVDDFGEELVRDQGRVGVVADDDAADAFRPAVGVEGVVLLLYVLALARVGALADRLGEEG